MFLSWRACLSCDGKIKGACVEHSVSHTLNHTSLPGKSSAFPSNCRSGEHIHSTLLCELESPISSIKGPFVFGYLFMDLFPSSLKMMSDKSTSRSVLCIMNEWSHKRYKRQPWWVSSEISNQALPHLLKSAFLTYAFIPSLEALLEILFLCNWILFFFLLCIMK